MRVPAAILVAWASLAPAPAAAQQLSRPTACDDCIANWFYFDQGGRTDWSCASSTYTGHRGSDFSLRGGLGAIDAGHDVIAAADGEVVSTQDGHFDRCTACGGANCGTDYGFGYGNHVVVNHGELRVVYAHLRTGSVRVSPGDRVRCGDALGQIASSGCSTGAHLHFETRPLGGNSTTAFDPFAGGCSPTSPSRWVEQGAHRGLPGYACEPPTPECPDGLDAEWRCAEGGDARRRCVEGEVSVQDCPHGCEVVEGDDRCRPEPPCPPEASTEWRCLEGEDARARCVEGDLAVQACPAGCEPGASQDVCVPMPGEDGGLVDGGLIDGGRADGGVADPPPRVLYGECGCRLPGGGGSSLGLSLVLFALLFARRRRWA